jgi:AcrR family transcriptional regulator
MKTDEGHPARKRPYRMSKRAAAAEDTGRRIVRAAVALYMERWLEDFTLEDVAARAGVTVQTVLRRYGSKAGLIEAAGEEVYHEVVGQRSMAPVGDIAGAVANLLEHYEAVGELSLRTLAQEERHDVLRRRAVLGRAVHRAWVETTFAPLLNRLSAATQERRISELVVVTDVYAWKLLRRDRGLDREQVERMIVEMVSALIERGGERTE